MLVGRKKYLTKFPLQTHMLIQYFQSSWKIPSLVNIIKKSCHNGMNIGPKNALTWFVWKSRFDIQKQIVEH
jgi:hypothetical protein